MTNPRSLEAVLLEGPLLAESGSQNLVFPTYLMSAFVNAIDTSLLARRSWVLREVIHGFSEEARTRGFPSPSFGGFSLISVASDLSIVAGWQRGRRSPMSALGR